MRINDILIKKVLFFNGIVFSLGALVLIYIFKYSVIIPNLDRVFNYFYPIMNWIYPSSIRGFSRFINFPEVLKNGISIDFLKILYLTIFICASILIISSFVALLKEKNLQIDKPKIILGCALIFFTDYILGNVSSYYTFTAMYIDAQGIFILKFILFYGLVFYSFVILISNTFLYFSQKMRNQNAG